MNSGSRGQGRVRGRPDAHVCHSGAAPAARLATPLSSGEQPRETSAAARAAVVVGPRAHSRHFRTPPERCAGARNARTESRPRGRGVEGMARHMRGTDLPREVRHGEVRAHRGVNPGTRLLCPLPPAAADRHLIFFTLSRKTAQKRAKTDAEGRVGIAGLRLSENHGRTEKAGSFGGVVDSPYAHSRCEKGTGIRER